MFLSLNIINHKACSIDRVQTLVKTDLTDNNVVDIILAYLLLNTKQKLIMHKIIHYIMYNQAIPRFKQSNQLLFFIKDKNGIDKS